MKSRIGYMGMLLAACFGALSVGCSESPSDSSHHDTGVDMGSGGSGGTGGSGGCTGAGQTNAGNVNQEEATACANLKWYINLMVCTVAAIPGGDEANALEQGFYDALKAALVQAGDEAGDELVNEGLGSVSELCDPSSAFTNWQGLLSAIAAPGFWSHVADEATSSTALAGYTGTAVCAIVGIFGATTPAGWACDAYLLARAALCMSAANYDLDSSLLGLASTCYVDSSHTAHSCDCNQRCVADPNESHGQSYGGWCIDASNAGNAYQVCAGQGVCFQQPGQTLQCWPPQFQSYQPNIGACVPCGGNNQPACTDGVGGTGNPICAPGLQAVGSGPPPNVVCRMPSPDGTTGSYGSCDFIVEACAGTCIQGSNCGAAAGYHTGVCYDNGSIVSSDPAYPGKQVICNLP